MTFTILQSVYKKDNPDYLSESLKSIAENTLLPSSVVLVKDGVLTPELESVISKWQEKLPLKVVGYEKNAGLAHALNFGLEFVETELVARMDSDDIAYKNRFEKQVLQFELNPELEILGGGIEEFYIEENYHNKQRREFNSNEIASTSFPNNESTVIFDSESKGSDVKIFRRVRLYPKWTDKKSKTLYRGTPVAHPTLMIKTSLLKELKYSENTKCNEDIDLWFRLLEAGHRIKTLQEPVLHFRITEGTFNRRSMQKAFNEFSIYSKNLHKINGFSALDIVPLVRLATRFFPKRLNKKLYLSKKRQNLFKENLMKIKSLNNQVFTKNGHLFEALLEFEENDTKMIKAVQLDSPSKCVVEVPAKDVELFKMSESVDVSLNV